MKKVLLISNVNKPNKNEIDSKAFEVSDLLRMPIKVLSNKGYQCYVGINRKMDDKECEIEGVHYYQQKIYRNPFNILEVYKGYKNLLPLLDNNKFDFIFCTTPLGGFIGRIIGKKYRLKVIYETHGFHFYKGAPLINWLFYYPIEKYLFKYTDYLITINNEDYEFAKNKMKFSNIYYIPSVGVDFSKILNNKKEIDNKRNELGIDEKAYIIISVGYLNNNKNHQLVIKAISKLKNNNIHYVIAGEGECRSKLLKMANKYDLSNNVHLLGYRKDVLDLYRISDLFVLPSLREGLSICTIEACLSNIPVLASNIRGPQDFLCDESLFYCNNVDDLSNKILSIINSNNQSMIEKNKQKLQKYSNENVESCFNNFFDMVEKNL